MSNVRRAWVSAALAKKGFALDDGRGDHDFYHLVVDGKKTHLFTKLSRGTKYRDLGAPLASAMATQVGLTKAEFLKLVECEIDGAALVKMLRARGNI